MSSVFETTQGLVKQDPVKFAIANDWGSGFSGRLIFKNSTNKPLKGWTFEFTTPFKLRQLWAGEIVKEIKLDTPNGPTYRYVVRHVSWTSNVPVNGSVEIGFNVDIPARQAGQPSGFVLDGVALGQTVPTPGDGNGWKAEYFDNQDLTGASLVRTDPTINFDWKTGSPDAKIAPDTFSARWTGKLLAQYNETYTFSVAGDDGLRLWVDGKLLIDAWKTQSATEYRGAIALKANAFYDIRLEYFENKGSASVKLSWQSQSQTKAIVPQSQLFSFFAPLQPPEPTPPILFQTNPPQTNPPQTNPPQATSLPAGQFNYGEALQKSFLFYEAQRSGDLPNRNRIAWRGDSSLRDGADVGRDLSGGYHDAGDHIKFGFPMASAMTVLSWGVVEYRAGYSKMSQLDEALDAIRWGTDWLLKAHVTDNQGTKEFWGQVGNSDTDYSVWGPAETLRVARPAYKIDRQNPGTDLAAEAAAALASASIIFRPSDTAYADRLLNNAIQLYAFADTYRGKYSDSIPDADRRYRSWSGYGDELVWGAAWLHEALEAKSKQNGTAKSNVYLNKAEAFYDEFFPKGLKAGSTLSWDNKSYGAAVLLAQETNKVEYRQDVETWLNGWLPGGTVAHTPGGLAWLDRWGSLRYSSNTSFLANVYGDRVNNPNGKYTNFAEDQIDYILGDNPRNSSYLVGFGNNSPRQPHHRGASGITGYGSAYEANTPNARVLYGALVGGPESASDYGYTDRRTNFVANEVALDYNAALTGNLARMSNGFSGQWPLSDAQLHALPEIQILGV